MRDKLRQGMNPRTYVLVGILVVTLVWVHSLGGRPKPAGAPVRAKGAGAPPATAAPAAPAGDKTGPSTPTPEGWGRDPFDPSFGGGRSS